MFYVSFKFLCSFIEELSTKEENRKTGCCFNFGNECTYIRILKDMFSMLQKAIPIIAKWINTSTKGGRTSSEVYHRFDFAQWDNVTNWESLPTTHTFDLFAK